MDTPKKEFEDVAREFEEVLANKLPGGLGGRLTRAERALLKTFYLFIQSALIDDESEMK